jgi:hypothetical protein
MAAVARADAFDQAAEIPLLGGGADRVESIMVELARRVGRCIDEERELFQLLLDDRPVARAGIGDAARQVRPDDQPLGARHLADQPLGVPPLGHVACQRHGGRMRESELQELRGGLERAGDQHHRIASGGSFRQRLDRRQCVVAGGLDHDVARTAE